MEKNIASHDLSDMMVYEGMDTQSRKFYFKQRFVPLQKIIEKCIQMFEFVGKLTKRKTRLHPLRETAVFSNTAAAVYSIAVASVLISFFWLTLLLDPAT